MTTLFMAFVGVVLAPLFIGKWRASLLGLACQGGLLAWIAYRLGSDPRSAVGFLTLFDLAVVRGLVAPMALHRVLRTANTPARNEVIRPNLISWTFALGIVLLAHNFAGALVQGGEQRTLVASATSAVLLAFLVLASQSGVFSQIVGALRFENGIALFELGGPGHPSLLVEIGQLLVVIATIFLYRSYLAKLAPPPTAGPDTSADAPTI